MCRYDPDDDFIQAVVEGRRKPVDPRQAPEALLAQHMAEGLGVAVSGAAIKRFLTENWWTVSRLAHAIHDNANPYRNTKRS